MNRHRIKLLDLFLRTRQCFNPFCSIPTNLLQKTLRLIAVNQNLPQKYIIWILKISNSNERVTQEQVPHCIHILNELEKKHFLSRNCALIETDGEKNILSKLLSFVAPKFQIERILKRGYCRWVKHMSFSAFLNVYFKITVQLLGEY